MASRDELDEHFDGTELDHQVWFPYYLPHWSSRERSAAGYAVRDGALHLSIPIDQGLWCADRHEEPLRVSCLQTGSFAGPLGSTVGQQPFRDGLTVLEEQPTFWGYTPCYGQVEVRMRAVISARSMVALWMSGLEDRPERCGEICVVEIFGDTVGDAQADVGVGIKAFRDPRLVQEFTAEPLPIDVTAFHTYAVDWNPGSLTFSVDGQEVRRLGQAPDYPVQLMLGVFDFPTKAVDPLTDRLVPELVVSHVRGRPAP